MRMHLSFEGGCRFTAHVRGHAIATDQPEDNGGGDTAPTPPELLAASLSGCVGFYVARYCERAGIDASGLRVHCDWQVGGKPRRIERFDLVVELPGAPEDRLAAIERVANSCLIHATLQHPPAIDIRLTTKRLDG